MSVILFLKNQITHIHKGGLKVIIWKVRRIIIVSIYFFPALALRLANFRFPAFLVSRIGHLLAEPDSYLKEERLRLTPKRRIVMLASKKMVANQAVLQYWRKYFIVISSPIVVRLLRHFLWSPLTGLDVSKYCIAINSSAQFYKSQALWHDQPPLLKIQPKDAYRGQKALEELGVSSDKWFVCIHSRGGGYSVHDEHYQSYRNCCFDDYILAIEYIISLGGICIVMGDSTMDPIPKVDNLIDYAHHPIRCDWLDLYIAANCRFFLGNTSGAFFMSAVFGVPVACANLVPLSSAFPFSKKDIGIPKLYKEVSSGRLLSFEEVLDSPMANFRYSSQFSSNGIELVNNSPEEIRDLAIEQLERITVPNFTYDKKDEVLQLRFKSLFNIGHYSYWSTSRVGRLFLRKYQHLLQ